MRRRQFIAYLGSAVASWPFAAHGAGSRPRLGYLSISSAEYETHTRGAAFQEGLQHLGYVEGKTIDIDYRFANGNTDSLTALAQELIQLRPNVIFADAVSPTRAIKRIAPDLPIVCPAFSDSFVPSLAASFAHPGGSVTGIASDVEGLIGKLTELTLDAIPGSSTIGFLSNPQGGSMARFEQQVQTAAKARGVVVLVEPLEKPGDLDGAMQKFSGEKVTAVIVPANGLLYSIQKQIIAQAMTLRLPLVFAEREGVAAGGLASYGINVADNYRRSAVYVDKILKGAAPGDLPIEFPTNVELIINLKTARTLGLTLPPALLSRADETIE
jgi:putative ABC transport system substrate-binding protein